MLKELEVTGGVNRVSPDYLLVVKTVEIAPGVKPGPVAEHESAHIFVALKNGTGVVMATIIPGRYHDGLTKLNRFDSRAFMAAKAKKCGGTGYDERVVMLMGYNPAAEAAAAGNIMENHDRELFAIASLLQLRGTISGAEAEMAIDSVENPLMEFDLIGPNGEKRTLTAKTRSGGRHFIRLGLPDEPDFRQELATEPFVKTETIKPEELPIVERPLGEKLTSKLLQFRSGKTKSSSSGLIPGPGTARLELAA